MGNAAAASPVPASPVPASPAPAGRTILGHPRGLAYLVFAAGAHRTRRRFRGTAWCHRSCVWTVVPGGAGLGDLRAVCGWGVPDAPGRRGDCRSAAGSHRDGHPGRLPDGARPLPDGLRILLPDCAQLSAHRRGLLQRQHRKPGRRALRARGPAARGRIPDLSARHPDRSDHLAAGVRHPGTESGLALGIRSTCPAGAGCPRKGPGSAPCPPRRCG